MNHVYAGMLVGGFSALAGLMILVDEPWWADVVWVCIGAIIGGVVGLLIN